MSDRLQEIEERWENDQQYAGWPEGSPQDDMQWLLAEVRRLRRELALYLDEDDPAMELYLSEHL
jgi:hypothetical protein